MYDVPTPPPEPDDWFSRHKGLAFVLAVGLAFVVPLAFGVAAGAFVTIAKEAATHVLAAVGGGLLVWSIMRYGR